MWSAISSRVPKFKDSKRSPRDAFRHIIEILLSLRFLPRRHASAVYAVVIVCLSVCTSQCSTEMVKLTITQTTAHDSSGNLVFCCWRSRQNSTGIFPNGGAKCRWVGVDFRQITRYNSKTWTVVSVVNLVRSQVYHIERPPLFVARLT